MAKLEKSPYYGSLQEVVDKLFGPRDEEAEERLSQLPVEARRLLSPTVVRMDVIDAAETCDLCSDLQEIVRLLPPATYTRTLLCGQLNSAICGHGWGSVYGTVE